MQEKLYLGRQNGRDLDKKGKDVVRDISQRCRRNVTPTVSSRHSTLPCLVKIAEALSRLKLNVEINIKHVHGMDVVF